MAVVLQTLVVNWNFVGGSRGAYIVRADTIPIFGYSIEYIEYLFLLMLGVAILSIVISRSIARYAARLRLRHDPRR